MPASPWAQTPIIRVFLQVMKDSVRRASSRLGPVNQLIIPPWILFDLHQISSVVRLPTSSNFDEAGTSM